MIVFMFFFIHFLMTGKSFYFGRDRSEAVSNLEARLRQIEEERARLKEPNFDDRLASLLF